jgi:hypothetical protein
MRNVREQLTLILKTPEIMELESTMGELKNEIASTADLMKLKNL